MDGDRFPRWREVYLLFNSDIVNYILKTTKGRDRRPNFVKFVIWSALIAGAWVVVAWSRKSCLVSAEIASFVCLFLFKDWGYRVSPKFHLFISDVNQRNEEVGRVQDFLA